MIELFKIMKAKDKISEEEFFSKMDSDRASSHSPRVLKSRLRVTKHVLKIYQYDYMCIK